MAASQLPAWHRVLVVVAHPDDESFGLGAVIDAFVAAGASVWVHCLTAGEASTLGAEAADLGQVRTAELAAAGAALGVAGTTLRHWPDGGLSELPPAALVADVVAAMATHDPSGLLVFDPSGVTAHPDHQAATTAAAAAGEAHGIPVLAWTLPAAVAEELAAKTGVPFRGHPPEQWDVAITVERTRQHRAITAHASQAIPGSVLWRRLELLGDREVLRWLVPPLPSDRSTLALQRR